MKDLSRQGLTHEQVYNALHSKSGTKEIKFRYDLIRNGVKHTEVDVLSASVSFDRFAEIDRTARFTIVKNQEIDWLNDQIKPYVLVKVQLDYKRVPLDWNAIHARRLPWEQIHAKPTPWHKIHSMKYRVKDVHTWTEFPLGVFILSTPREISENGEILCDVEAYSRAIILREDCITERLFFAKGTKYIDAVNQIILSAGIGDVLCDNSEITLPTDREFEIGESKLKLCNTLLSEINFNPVTVSENGTFLITKYIEPNTTNVSYVYRDDALSVICNDTQSETDFYSVPNVFIAVVSNPEIEGDMKSVFVNDNPSNRLSTVSRKRKIVSEICRPDVIATQAELDTYIRKIAFEKSQVQEKLEFYTDLMPFHGRAETLEIHKDEINGVYVESGWNIDLSISGTMRHEARRYVSI